MSKEQMEVIRYEFLSDWLKSATEEEIIEKLIQNDERAKLITKQQKEIEIHKGNFETLNADIIQVKKDLGLPEDLIIADEMVIEIKKKYVEKDKYENAKKDSDKWFKKLQEVQKKENSEKKKLNEIIDDLIVCLAEEQGVEEDEIREAFCHE